ncbi:MAG: hypothetical protein IKX88_11140 [Thermoguttaceae bacterium]|nr:hypothetical protein [Thermoguttaceae bacterium]MBR5759136.1 hypothetical protein [Thermoguttaceae bacterium]
MRNNRKLSETVLFSALVAASGVCLTFNAFAARADEPTKYRLSDNGKVLEEYLGSGETFIVPEGVKEIQNEAFVHGALLTRIMLLKSVNVGRSSAYRL